MGFLTLMVVVILLQGRDLFFSHELGIQWTTTCCNLLGR